MADRGGVCIVIPMYNEQDGAENCVRAVCSVLDKLEWRSALLVVDDGSKDDTGAILERLAPQCSGLRIVHHQRNAGYGAALRTGVLRAAEAGYEYVLFMDSDLTNNPADIPRFVDHMRRGVDVIKASRFAGNGGMRGVPFRRAAISRLGNLVARSLFRVGVRDCTNGFRAVRLELLKHAQLRETGFPVIVEELYHLKFLASSWAEVPVILTNRQQGLRPTSFSYRPSTFWKYLRFALRAGLGIRPAPEKTNEK